MCSDAARALLCVLRRRTGFVMCAQTAHAPLKRLKAVRSWSVGPRIAQSPHGAAQTGAQHLGAKHTRPEAVKAVAVKAGAQHQAKHQAEGSFLRYRLTLTYMSVKI